jgi:metallo-beta-lactamase family protein
MLQIKFLGATGTVTGSKYLLETGKARILVDCGLFQGLKNLRERNWADFPVEPSTLNAIVLTHAHIDHSGYLPRLCKMGFKGKVFCTSGTRDLLQILLPDAGYLQEEEAAHANKWKYSKHSPALPLYTRVDAENSLKCLAPVEYHEKFSPVPGVTASYTRAGHIIGAGCLQFEVQGKTITFSGDVGRPHDFIMKSPESLPKTDYLVIESTYGDRLHPVEDVSEIIARTVNETVKRGGIILVPAFAVGRSQEILQILADLRKAGRIPKLPIYLDSPMAIAATDVFRSHKEDHLLNDARVKLMYDVAHFTTSSEESKSIDQLLAPMIIVSASGMATGGRILHHLRKFLPDEKNTVLIVGYQASGTRGRSITDGAKSIKMFGEQVEVNAQVVQLYALSAHADYAEMTDWLKKSAISPKRVFITHGEPEAAKSFQQLLKKSFGWNVIVPGDGETWKLE